MMTKLKKEVTKLVDQEIVMACDDHGDRFHSAHEAFAVIREELEETGEEISDIDCVLRAYWRERCRCDSPFDDNESDELLESLKNHAINAACEAVQVAAMAEKALRGYEVDDERTAVHQG